MSWGRVSWPLAHGRWLTYDADAPSSCTILPRTSSTYASSVSSAAWIALPTRSRLPSLQKPSMTPSSLAKASRGTHQRAATLGVRCVRCASDCMALDSQKIDLHRSAEPAPVPRTPKPQLGGDLPRSPSISLHMSTAGLAVMSTGCAREREQARGREREKMADWAWRDMHESARVCTARHTAAVFW